MNLNLYQIKIKIFEALPVSLLILGSAGSSHITSIEEASQKLNLKTSPVNRPHNLIDLTEKFSTDFLQVQTRLSPEFRAFRFDPNLQIIILNLQCPQKLPLVQHQMFNESSENTHL